MWKCSLLIAECVWLKIVHTLLTLRLISSKQPLYTQYFYATNHILIIDLQYCVCMYYHLHPGGLLPLNFWSTTIYTIWVRNGVAQSHSRDFGRQLMACRSFHYFLVNIARLPHHSSSSFFSSISMTYHKQFQISQIMCTRSVRGVMQLDTWINLAWQLSFRSIRHAHWLLSQWHVWHRPLKFC